MNFRGEGVGGAIQPISTGRYYKYPDLHTRKLKRTELNTPEATQPADDRIIYPELVLLTPAAPQSRRECRVGWGSTWVGGREGCWS